MLPPTQITSVTSEPVARLGSVIQIEVGGDCPTLEEFLPDNNFWYAYFGNKDLSPECCGTDRVNLA